METLGILLFFGIAGMAFWLLIFLVLFIPYMITLMLLDKVKPEWAAWMACIDEEPA